MVLMPCKIDFLKSEIKSGAYRHQGKISNNFSSTLNSPQSALQAISMFKDEYLLDFMNVEELGERDKSLVDERVVENGIIHNIKNFIMTFGKDFAYIGNQYHLEKFENLMKSRPLELFFVRMRTRRLWNMSSRIITTLWALPPTS